MKKILKRTAIAITVPFAVILLLALLLYVPPVQNWAVREAAAYATEHTGMDVHVGRVSLLFPLRLGMTDVKVLQKNDSIPQRRDTLADIHRLAVDVELLPLFHKQVMVDRLDFEHIKVNTLGLIHEARIKGNLNRLSLRSRGIDLKKEFVRVNDALVSGGSLSVELSDTVPPDTTPSTNFWKIGINNLNIKHTAFALHMPGDTTSIRATLSSVRAQQAFLDLHKSLYSVGRLEWLKGALNYDNNFMPRLRTGVDANHLALDSITLVADSFFFCSPDIRAAIRRLAFRGPLGISVSDAAAHFSMDDSRLTVPDLRLKTPYTALNATYSMDMDAFADSVPGTFALRLAGSIGHDDIMRFMPVQPAPMKAIRKVWPTQPVSVSVAVRGNLHALNIEKLTAVVPTLASASMRGRLADVTDSRRMTADAAIELTVRKGVNRVIAAVAPDAAKTVYIPDGTSLKGQASLSGTKIAADMGITSLGGRAHIKGGVNTAAMAYNAKIDAFAFPLHAFLPGMRLKDFSGNLTAAGHGTDAFSSKTSLTAKGSIRKFGYDKYRLDNTTVDAKLSGGRVSAVLNCGNSLVDGLLRLNALMSRKKVDATLVADLKKADLYRLGLVDQPLTASFCGQIDAASDLGDNIDVQGLLGDIAIADSDSTYRPEDVVIDIMTRRDTTHAVADCADFHLDFNASDGYKRLTSYAGKLADEIKRQIAAREINQEALRKVFPTGNLYLTTGKYNFIAGLIRRYGFDYKKADIDMSMSARDGLNGTMAIDSLVYVDGGVRIDTIRWKFMSNDKDIAYKGFIRNAADNTPTFTADIAGDILNNGTKLDMSIYDHNGQLGFRLPLMATINGNSVRTSIPAGKVVLGYKEFSVNNDNFVLLTDSGRLSADVKLKSSDGQGVQIYTNDANTAALQDVTLSLNKFDLQKVLSVIPYAPDVAGIFNGDFHAVKTTEALTVSSSVTVNDLAYQGSRMGNIGLEFVYMPKDDGTHQVNGFLLSDGRQVATIDGTYNSAGKGMLDARLGLLRTPLSYINGFIPDHIIGLKGYGEGELTVKGTLSAPKVNGEVFLDSGYLVSEPYGVQMRFADDPVRIEDSKLLFENFEMFANNDQPLDIAGTFDFSNLDRMMLNIRMQAHNFEIIDAKKNARSEAYGKTFVNFFGMMRGPVDNLVMGGRLEVLGSTDMTYVLRESELSTDNELNELVKFTDFSDSTHEKVNKPVPQGLRMSMSVSVDEAAHIVCALNADESNYIDLMGGGDLMLKYDPVNEITLTGRYTLSNGEMKYSLPVIPLKTFNIQDGSYLEFTGNPYNPTLNITATEDVKSMVEESAGNARQVDFTCGVKITKTLESPGIQFIINASNDMTIQDQLNTMSAEEQSKIAIAMLATGMYLSDGNTSSFSMNSALSSFLNSQINNIAGTAMRSMGLDLGMTVDNTATETGSIHTDYNFKFAKRFWNNRLSLVVGGKVSTGADIVGDNSDNTFFNNVELQYRLNQQSSQYMRLFYNNNVYDWLEGKIGEYGAGFTWRRKMQHFKDIINFKTDRTAVPAPSRRDSSAVRTAAGNSNDSTSVPGNKTKK